MLAGVVQLWNVYGFALLLGCVTAFDAPARQAFVSDLVSDDDLANAVALNSASFNAARMLGPAVAGVLIAAIGEGWLFVVNAGSYAAVLVSDRKSTRLNSITNAHLVCRLLLEKKNNQTNNTKVYITFRLQT